MNGLTMVVEMIDELCLITIVKFDFQNLPFKTHFKLLIIRRKWYRSSEAMFSVTI